MKTIVIFLVLFLSVSTFGQSHLTFSTKPIDAVMIVFEKTLSGQVEYDGHTFDNKKSSDPVKFRATLSGVKIFDSKREYEYRKCDKESCNIIHLKEKYNNLYNGSIRLTPYTISNNTFFNN